jgi:hypothetical protein
MNIENKSILMNIENKSDLYIENNTIYEPELGEYKIYIDSGDLTLWGVKYNFSLESTHIQLTNRATGSEMLYFFKDYIFSISNQYCQIRGERIFIDGNSFNLNVYRGRLIPRSVQSGNQRKFVVRNNNFEIDGFFLKSRMEMERKGEVARESDAGCMLNSSTLKSYINSNNTNLFRNNKTEMINISNDSQNTHDVFILDYLVDIYDKIFKIIEFYIIRGNGNFIEHGECEIDILNKCYILNKNIEVISEVLNYIRIHDGFLMRIQNTETEILKIVWNLIRDENDLIEIFLDNLADNRSTYGFHCLTGRISRMLNTFSGINIGELKICKNLNAAPISYTGGKLNKQLLINEMMNICSKVREEMEMEMEMETGINEDELRNRIKKKLIIDYVNTNILSIEQLDNVISGWIEHIT